MKSSKPLHYKHSSIAIVTNVLRSLISPRIQETPLYRTRPALELVLRSLVCTFLRPLPAWIEANKAPRSAPPAGAGGAAAGGGGGTPGGAAGGAGGGGGGIPESPAGAGAGGGGGGGGIALGAAGSSVSAGLGEASCTGVADCEGDLLSIALNGRGGAMVPNRMLASCFALPPPGFSSSSSESSKSDPAADQSSSSGRARDFCSNGLAPVKAGLAISCCARRWKGLVDWTSGEGAAG